MKLFGKTFLILVAAGLCAPTMLAQDSNETFREAIRLLRLNKKAEALAKLEEVVRSNPSNEDAFRLWRETDAAVFELLLAEQGEFGKIAKHLMELATVERKAQSRDQGAIDKLVADVLSDDYGVRSKAMVALAAEHGEFAVPALLKILGDPNQDSGQDRAMLALFRIGHSAVLPLIAALATDNDLLRRNIVAALVHIGDRRAAPSFARLAKQDGNEAVRTIATQGLGKLGVTPGSSAVDLKVAAARAYLTGGTRQGEHSDVVWSWGEDGLVAVDVPPTLYHLELAKKCALAAMQIDPTNDAAKSLLARSYLAQVAAIKDSLAANPDDSAMQELSAGIEQLRMVALANGPAVLRSALVDSMREGMSPVAVAAIDALATEESRTTLASSPLIQALDSQDSRIAYAAALALAKASGGQVPEAGKVVARLGDAVAEEAVRLIKVVDANPLTERAVKEAGSSVRGIAVDAAASARKAIADIYSFPNYDVVVVSDTLPDALPEDVISLIRKRAPNTKVLLLANSDEAGEKYQDRVDGVIRGPLSGANLLEKANEVMDSLDARRARATEIAIDAGGALRGIARANVSIVGALDSLQKQLDRDDAVAIPAAQALGEGGNAANLAALARVVKRDEASADLRIAAADAAGKILARIADAPAGFFDEMLAMAVDAGKDAKLRSAIVAALGRAKLAPGERLKLVEALNTIAKGASNDG